MHNPRIAGRYAKSLIDLSVEKKQLEVVYKDMLFLRSVIKSSHEFVNLLKSPVIKADKKDKILEAITKGRVSILTASFNKLMVSKGREEYLPEIVEAFITSYNAIKNIHKVRLSTAQPVSEELKKSIVNKFISTTNMLNIELETVVKPELVGGFVLEYNNNLIDASILRDLQDIKKQFQQNIFVSQLR